MDDRLLRAVLRIAQRSRRTGFPDRYPPVAAWDRLESEAGVRRAWGATAREGGPADLRVQIPFCRSRCSFCSLEVWASSDRERVPRYLRALAAEAALYSPIVRPLSFRSVYLGGGTPTALAPSELSRLVTVIRSNFSLAQQAQVSIEANPDALDRPRARLLKSLGVNRVLLGVQSLDPRLLRSRGRSHTPGAARRAFEALRAARIEGIDVDLLAGLPGQSPEGFLRDVAQVAGWEPDRIRLNAHLDARARLGRCRGLQGEGLALLEKAGYRRLDAISAGKSADALRPRGARALAQGCSILGLGAAAFSYARGRYRHVNSQTLEDYFAKLERGRLPCETGISLRPLSEKIDFVLESLEYEGRLSVRAFRRRFGRTPDAALRQDLRRLEGKGVLRQARGSFELARRAGAAFECSKQLYEPEIIDKILRRCRLEPGNRAPRGAYSER